jgi:uncharacterized protein YndB with AHSA1/START domain
VSATDAVTVTTIVSVAPASAFRIFTEDVDRWWRRGSRFRPALRAGGTMRFEPGVGGRLVEIYGEAEGDLFEVGRVLIWEPGRRLVFDWRGRNFARHEKTTVEVRFEAEGDGTRVVLEHRGWDGIPADHLSRHGLEGSAFTALIGLFWADLLVRMRRQAAAAVSGS